MGISMLEPLDWILDNLQLYLLVSVVAKVNVEDAVLLGLHMSPLCLTHGWAHQYV